MPLNFSMMTQNRFALPFATRAMSLFVLLLALVSGAQAQTTLDCPPNIDFETGTYGYWSFYTGTCCPINTPTLSGPVANRHVITTGSANDPYGNFPIVAPGGGNTHSLKLGNNSTGAQAERARYYIHVPATVNNYSLIYRYAVVFENPNHTAAQQPRFEVKAYDSATNTLIPCADRSYVAASSLPGFTLSNLGSNVWYLPWTTATLNLSGLAGHTVIVDFASGDCSQSGHFGYGYVDLNCGLFQISTLGCNIGGNTTLTAPAGYQGYTWMDSALTTVIGTTQTISIPTPSVTTKYKVILTPYTGYGCPDTLQTQILISNIAINPTPDTVLCVSAPIQLHANLTGGLGTINYSWTPSSTLSCSNCADPIANPFSTTTYTLTVSDSSGCTRTDSVKIFYQGVNFNVTKQDISCYGANNGSINVSILSGPPPFTFSWNTSPVQTTSNLSNLGPGTYTLTLNDSIGCTKTATINIIEPTNLTFTSSLTHVLCNGSNNGEINISAAGGTSPYKYSKNGGPFGSSNVFSTLTAGTYPISVKDTNNCIKYDTVVITQPPAFSITVDTTNILCNGATTGVMQVHPTGGVKPYTFALNSSAYGPDSLFNNLAAGTYTVHVKDSNNCQQNKTAYLTQPTAIVPSVTSLTHEPCYADSVGEFIVTATGGVPPYLYAINSGAYDTSHKFSKLIAGSYTLHVKDSNNCVKDTVIVVNQPTIIVPNVTITQPLCYGDANGVLTISGSGGTPSFTYALGTGSYGVGSSFTGLIAGTYTLHIKDVNLCLHDTTVTMGQPTPLQFSTYIMDNKCFGDTSGKVNVTASGATPAYSYAYDSRPFQSATLLTGFTAGNHVIHVKDQNGCSKDANVTLTQPDQLYLHAWIKNPTCEGFKDGVISLYGSGGVKPYMYSTTNSNFSPINGFSGFGEGSYVYYIQDSNLCVHDTTFVLTGYPYIRYTADVTDVSCYGFKDGEIKFNVTGGVPPFQYQLQQGIFSWQSSNVFDSLKRGKYMFEIKDSKNCVKDTSITITQPDKLIVKAFVTPNDCEGKDDEGGVRADVSGGTTPYQYIWNTTPAQLTQSVTGVPNGKYYVYVKDDHNCQDSAKALVAYDNCCTPYIPDAFTPNADGKNDVFRVRFKGDMTLQGFSIFNRYGQRLFFTTNINEAWDGTFAGRPQDMDTYFYYIKAICGNKGNNEVEFKGDVTLIR